MATGGVSLLFEWALEELSKIGRKPIITWEQFPGPWAPRVDRIEVSTLSGVAPPNTVEVVLRTDPGSHLKILEFEPYAPRRRRSCTGRGSTTRKRPERQHATADLDRRHGRPGVRLRGVPRERPPGRYVLAELGRKLTDRSQVTFHWKDS